MYHGMYGAVREELLDICSAFKELVLVACRSAVAERLGG